MIGHNGGPGIEADGAKLRYVKINITEILEGIEALGWEQRGYYLTALFKMYARMGGIPADDHEGAKVMRCDVRLFRRLRDQLVAAGKFYIEEGVLRNARVEREIADYVREFRRRQEAALLREQRKRLADTIQKSSAGSLAEVSQKSRRSLGEVSEKSGALGPNYRTRSTDALPQSWHEEGDIHKPLTINHNLDSTKNKKDRGHFRSAEVDGADAPSLPSIDPYEPFRAWNDLAVRIGLPVARTLTPARRKSLCARLREHGPASWATALANVERSAFLRGRNDRGWRADFDFVVQPSSYAKLVEGSYGNGAHAEDSISRMRRLMGQADQPEILPPETRR